MFVSIRVSTSGHVLRFREVWKQVFFFSWRCKLTGQVTWVERHLLYSNIMKYSADWETEEVLQWHRPALANPSGSTCVPWCDCTRQPFELLPSPQRLVGNTGGTAFPQRVETGYHVLHCSARWMQCTNCYGGGLKWMCHPESHQAIRQQHEQGITCRCLISISSISWLPFSNTHRDEEI